MRPISSFLKNVNVLNVLLAGVIAYGAYYLTMSMPNPDINITAAQMNDGAAVSQKEFSLYTKMQSNDYALVSDQNIFHPERKIPPDKKEEKAVPKPEVILYGTLITQQESIAFIEDKKSPRTTPGRGKRQTALHKGESLSGYTLTEIKADSIALVRGEEKIMVLLEEGEKRKAAGTAGLPQSVSLPAVTSGKPGNIQPAVSASPKAAPTAQADSKTAYTPMTAPTDGGENQGVRLPARRNAAQIEVIRKRERAAQMQGQ